MNKKTQLHIQVSKCKQIASHAYERAIDSGLHDWEAKDIFDEVYKQELQKRNIYTNC